MKQKILLTGSCGFIFSNFLIKYCDSDYEFVSVDKIISTYNLNNIYQHKNHKFYLGDIADEHFMNNVFSLEKPDFVIHGAAESFVDDSIASAKPFIHSNVVGTQVMVDLSVKHKVKKFIYVSTDEVYGQLFPGDTAWTEDSIVAPRNPYSASKAAGELIVRAAAETHKLLFNITRCSNNFGPRQPPRNLIPKIITCLIHDKEIPIHGSGNNYREWLYVLDHCSAIMTVLENGKLNETYNVGSGFELSNLETVYAISKVMNKVPKITFVKDRASHDKRYSVNYSKLNDIGWRSQYTFDNTIKSVCQWYIDNQEFYK